MLHSLKVGQPLGEGDHHEDGLPNELGEGVQTEEPLAGPEICQLGHAPLQKAPQELGLLLKAQSLRLT